MNTGRLTARFETVFAEPMLERIRIAASPEGEAVKITIDVHGLTCREAKRFISNTVNLSGGCCITEIIHGYRQGTRIRDMIRNKFSNPHIRHIIADFRNPGITCLQPA